MKKLKKFEQFINESFKTPTPPNSLFKAKKLSTAINRSKIWLKSQAKKHGLWENFGQDIVSKLEDTYINSSSYTDEMNRNRDMIQVFNNWCMNYS